MVGHHQGFVVGHHYVGGWVMMLDSRSGRPDWVHRPDYEGHFAMKSKANYTGPFRRMVALGDSIAYGMYAYQSENEWVQVVAKLLRKFQDVELEVFNRGLPASVISPRCPGYGDSAKPSLIERYHRHCIELQPDLVIMAEGLNDMRSGMPVQEYIADLETIVADIQRKAGALVVLVGIYHQIFGCEANDPAEYPTWTKWDHNIAQVYSLAIRLVADKHNALFVDALSVLGGADWALNPDCCHLNDLGHVLVGNAIFQTIATHCAGVGAKTLRLIEELQISIADTGGTDTNEEIQILWRQVAARFGVELK
jgi:lysophospholipase L1-like esterase